MIILGIESTAHTFGVGLIKANFKGRIKVLSNIHEMYTTKKGGIIPFEAGKHHKKVCDKVYKETIKKAKIRESNISLISYSSSPGLPPCLIVGRNFARELALKLNVPLVGVNHCIAHLEIGKSLTSARDPVLLYCSGANTQVIVFTEGKYRIFGETLDVGIGNFIDSFGRYIGLGFPAGPKIEKLALKGKKFIKLPYLVKGMDVAFSGLLTNLKKKFDSKTQENQRFSRPRNSKRISREFSVEDLCFSLQETAFAMLIETAERAMAHCGKKELLLGGGVACNKRLQEMAAIMCKERGAKCFALPNEFNVDNGVMIADLGYKMFKSGISVSPSQAEIYPYQRTNEVKVKWRKK